MECKKCAQVSISSAKLPKEKKILLKPCRTISGKVANSCRLMLYNNYKILRRYARASTKLNVISNGESNISYKTSHYEMDCGTEHRSTLRQPGKPFCTTMLPITRPNQESPSSQRFDVQFCVIAVITLLLLPPGECCHCQ